MTRGTTTKQTPKRRRISGEHSARANDGQEAPWPRDDGHPFSGPDIANLSARQRDSLCAIRRASDAPWGAKESVLYNAWLKITFKPARFLCHTTLQRLRIRDEVGHMLHRIGLGTIAAQYHPLYAELSTQFFASVEMDCREGTDQGLASSYFIYFLIRGRRYELPIGQLCSVYGFDATREGTSFPTIPYGKLWESIGTTADRSRVRKVARIHNPILRVVAKILGSLFFGKEEVSAVSNPEMVMLHYGLPGSAYTIYGDEVDSIPPIFDTNLGFAFADILVQRKTRVLKAKSTLEDHMGSLLTPIFMACGVDLTHEVKDETVALLDDRHLRSAHILSGDNVTYEYTDVGGVLRHCRLPVADFMAPTSAAALRFSIPPEEQVNHADTSTRRLRQQPPPPSQRESYSPPPQGPRGNPIFQESSDSEDYHFPEVPLDAGTSEMWQVAFANDRKANRLVTRLNRRMKAMARWLACGAPPRAQTDGPESSSAAARGGEH